MAGTQSIQRAIALLRLVAQSERADETAATLAQKLRLDRTTTHRILSCLADERLLTRSSERGQYRLGPLLYQFGLIAAERLDLRKLCHPSLARIAAEVGDTVFLMIREGHESVCADRLSGSFPVKTLVVDIGTRRPLGVGAGSLAILAALPPEEAEAALDANAKRIASYDGISLAAIRKRLPEVRASHQVSVGVVDVEGTHAVAVPVSDSAGRAVAALSIAAIAPRMSRDRQAQLFEILQREARAITALLRSGEVLG